MPETLRAMVGNGSTPPSKYNRPLVPLITLPLDPSKSVTSTIITIPNPLRLLIYPNVIMILFINGLYNALFYALSVTIATKFQDKYPFLTQAKLGLCFLPVGLGFGTGSLVTGRIIDRDYAAILRERGERRERKRRFSRLNTRG